MKKRIIYLIFTIFLFNLFTYNSLAIGICEGKEKGTDSYCTINSLTLSKTGTDLNFRGTKPYPTTACTSLPTDSNSHTCRYRWFLIDSFAGYETNNSENKFQAICIDPSMAGPEGVPYSLGREVLSDSYGNSVKMYDSGIYNAYQVLISELGVCGTDENCKKMNKIAYQFALRAWTYKIGFHAKKDTSTWPGEWEGFAACAHLIDSSINSSNNDKDVLYCFGTDANKELIQKYYDAAYKYYIKIEYNDKNEITNQNEINQKLNQPFVLWENTLNVKKITKTPKKGGNDNYEYGFEFSGLTNFFTHSSDGGVLELDDAKITANLYLNGTLKETKTITNGTNNVEKLSIVMTEQQYKQNFADGKGSIKVIYTYNHPILKENLFITKDSETPSHQRMLVMSEQYFTDFEEILIGGYIEEKVCSHTKESGVNKFIKNNSETTLSDFISSCGCDLVEKNLLNTSELATYKNKCEKEKTQVVETNIADCIAPLDRTEEKYKNYYIKYTNTSYPNNYCEKICVENINIIDLREKFVTTTGLKFNFQRYPTLSASKDCKTTFKQDEWLNDYKNRLLMVVNAYNEYQKYLSVITNAEDGNIYSYSYNYQKLNISNGINLYETTETGTLTNTNDKSIYIDIENKRLYFSNAMVKLTELLEAKKSCSSSIKNATAETFYNFDSEINFYYQQQYKILGLKYNNQRGSNHVDDSGLKRNKVDSTDNSIESGDNFTYNNISYNPVTKVASISTENIENTTVNRIVTYTYKHEPAIYKYGNPITGKIIGDTNPNNEYIPIGRYYDTDITAVAKDNNIFYYEFKRLGDQNDKYLFTESLKQLKEKINASTLQQNSNNIIRACTYKTENELTPKNILFKIVDPDNVDPNNRKEQGKGLKNWNEEDILAIEEEDTYNPENIQYSFNLDMKTLKEIREYNTGKSYSDFTLDCENGNNCESIVIDCLENSRCSLNS